MTRLREVYAHANTDCTCVIRTVSTHIFPRSSLIALDGTELSPAVVILCGFPYLPVAPSAKVRRFFLYI